MNPQSLLSAFRGQAATCRERLHHGHVALDSIRARSLYFAVNVEDRRPLNVQDVAAAHQEVPAGVRVSEHVLQINHLPHVLAVARTDEDHRVRPGSGDPPGGGTGLGNSYMRAFDRLASS